MTSRDGWHLFVALEGGVADWPSHDWPDGAPIPTVAERTAVLADLGYEIEPRAEWSWVEDMLDEAGTAPAYLIAHVPVRPIRSGGNR
ncbi:DUF6303 family protein [Streptomyces sp. NPDC093225]|uniref:DUF6303 family protein n=1 Tax=Streptomyces sp. NPDC093225 TaxID=3366034 RepID=UPI00380D7428